MPDGFADSLTVRLKKYARAIGFDAVGIAPVRAYPHAAFFTEWLRRGYQGTMTYLGRNADRRLDPTKVIPGARSIVCLAKRYRTADVPQSVHADSSRGIVSCYAWGDDYHDVLKKKLRALLDWIRETASEEAQARAYVDSGAVLEREAAMLAGLGWFGKNTMLLSRALGSYFFLAEIITNVAFEPDEPTTDHCGTCRACLDACPTGAFPEPYVLDATKCISYLTIELKGPIPADLRRLVGNHIFGCDICQEVCPWNRKAPLSNDPAYQPREGSFAPLLEPLMTLTGDEFRRRYRRSPILRAKRRGFLRNVAVALGNRRDPSAIAFLQAGLKDDEPLVRGHAAWALGRVGNESAIRTLVAAKAVETDPYVRGEIDAALEAAQNRREEDVRSANNQDGARPGSS